MKYEEFKQSWLRGLRESGLPQIGGGEPEESLDLRSTDRTCESFVEPIGGQDAAPFWVSARLSWRWRSVQTARAETSEEDWIREVLGREGRVRTERPWLRVDVSLRASTLVGEPIPMPTPSAWARWAREAMERLERIEPLVPQDSVREDKHGRLAILAWQGEPKVHAICGADGGLSLSSIQVASWQAIELPRRWSDSSRKADPPPDAQLRELFNRLKLALHAWMEVTDHLRPKRP